MWAVWIQDLFLDGYLEGRDGAEDLALHGLAEGANVVRVESPQAADLLGVSIGALLGNEGLPRGIRRLVTRPRGGSLIAHHQTQSLDLCRLRQPDATLGPRQLLADAGDAAAVETAIPSVLRARDAFGEASWWSLFTDLMPAANRISEWQRRGWWQRLAVIAGDQQLPAREEAGQPIKQTSDISVSASTVSPQQSAACLVPHERGILTRVSVLDANNRPTTSVDHASRSHLQELEEAAERQWWHQHLAKYTVWRDAQQAAWTTNLAANLAGEPSSVVVPLASFPSLSDLKLRESWLHARQRAEQLAQALARREAEANGVQAEILVRRRALPLQALSDRCRALENQRPPEFTASQEDFARLKRIERRLQETRTKLRQLAASAARPRSGAAAPLAPPILFDPATAELDALLADWPACEAALSSSAAASVAASMHDDDAFRRLLLESEASVASLVAAVRAASHRLRATRHHLANQQFVRQHLDTFPPTLKLRGDDEAAASTGTGPARDAQARKKKNRRPGQNTSPAREAAVAEDSGAAVAPASPDSATLDERRDSLHRQIRQLRDETQQLLARQILSRHALLGIGLLFSAGVAILLAAIFLDLDGAEMLTGIIGLTCLMAAGLLKASFERAPSEQLRRQRLRIVELLRELDQLPIPWEDYLQQSASAGSTEYSQSTATAACAREDGDERADTRPFPAAEVHDAPVQDAALHAAERACEDAWRDWHLLLEEHQFPLETRPTEVVRAVREQYRLTRDELHRHVRDQVTETLPAIVEDWSARAADWCRVHLPSTAWSAAGEEISLHDWHAMLSNESARRDTSRWTARVADASATDSAQDGTDAASLPIGNLLGDTDRGNTEHSGETAEIVELQLQVRQLKRRRQRLLDAAGVQQVEQYEAAILEGERWRQIEEQARRGRAELETQLAACGDAEPRIREWLETGVDLEQEARAAETQWEQLRLEQASDQRAYDEALRLVREALRQRATDAAFRVDGEFRADGELVPSLPRTPAASETVCTLLGLVLEDVRTRRTAARRQERIVAHAAVRATVPPLASHGFLLAHGATSDVPLLLLPTATLPAATLPLKTTPAATPSTVTRREIPLRPLLRATAWLRSLLQQPDLQLLVHASDESGLARIAWVDRLHGRRPLTKLEPALQELTTVCLQLALAEELRGEAGHPAWIFTDRSFDLPAPLGERLVERLQELASDGQQVIVVTHRGQVTAWCEEQDFRKVDPLRTPAELPLMDPAPLMAPVPLIDTGDEASVAAESAPPVAPQASGARHRAVVATFPDASTFSLAGAAVPLPRVDATARRDLPSRSAFLAGESLRALAAQVASEPAVEPARLPTSDESEAWRSWHEPTLRTTDLVSSALTTVVEPQAASAETDYPIVEVTWDRAE